MIRSDWQRCADASETWAGMTFLLTCGVLCLAIVGIVCGGIAQRPWWLGFALFGWAIWRGGVLVRTLDKETWPALPTDHLLSAVRGWFPPLASGFSTGSDGITSANARIHRALEQAVPIRPRRNTAGRRPEIHSVCDARSG